MASGTMIDRLLLAEITVCTHYQATQRAANRQD
jgi:hypothetical protein